MDKGGNAHNEIKRNEAFYWAHSDDAQVRTQ